MDSCFGKNQNPGQSFYTYCSVGFLSYDEWMKQLFLHISFSVSKKLRLNATPIKLDINYTIKMVYKNKNHLLEMN